jgi:transposase
MGKKWARTQEIFDAHMPDIERAYEAGAEIKEIAARFGVSAPTITNWLIAAGYRRRKRGRYPNAMKEKAVELANRGWSAQAIANLFQVKINFVLDWIGEEAEQTIEYRTVYDPNLYPEKRHKRGRRWTEEQKLDVLDKIELGLLSVEQIYHLTGASRRRQSEIWREYRYGRFPLAKERPARLIPLEPVEQEEEAELVVVERSRPRREPEAIEMAVEVVDETTTAPEPPIGAIEEAFIDVEAFETEEDEGDEELPEGADELPEA